MMNTLHFDAKKITQRYEAARKRVRSGQKGILSKLKPGQQQTRYYGLFEDSLEAAGLAKALSKPESEIRDYLKIAANAAVGIFEWQYTTIGKVGYLPNYDEEVFIDNTAANPWVYVRAVYAALAAELHRVLKTLANYDAVEQEYEHMTISPLLREYSQILRKVILRETENLNLRLQQLVTNWSTDESTGSQFWLVQAKVLLAVIEGNGPGFVEIVGELSSTISSYYAAPEHQNDPDRFLQLPVLGLNALGKLWGIY